MERRFTHHCPLSERSHTRANSIKAIHTCAVLVYLILPIIGDEPRFYVTECSSRDQETIFSIGGHRSDTITGHVNAIETVHVSAGNVIGKDENFAVFRRYKDVSYIRLRWSHR